MRRSESLDFKIIGWILRNCTPNNHIQIQHRTSNFKFINSTVDLGRFYEIVSNSWSIPMNGRPMAMVQKKLLRLQPIIRKLSKPLADVIKKIEEARDKLHTAQKELKIDRMNSNWIEKVKKCFEELIKWQEMEFNFLKQRTKIEWLRLTDGNNKYFYASIKARQQFKSMKNIQKSDGSYVSNQQDLELEVMAFYKKYDGQRIQ